MLIWERWGGLGPTDGFWSIKVDELDLIQMRDVR